MIKWLKRNEGWITFVVVSILLMGALIALLPYAKVKGELHVRHRTTAVV
jgi:hypothetical protein